MVFLLIMTVLNLLKISLHVFSFRAYRFRDLIGTTFAPIDIYIVPAMLYQVAGEELIKERRR